MYKSIASFLLLACMLVTSGCAASQETAVEVTYGKTTMDITDESSNVAYALVYNITKTPEDYEDYVVILSGIYGNQVDEETGETYHVIAILDEMECCGVAIEVVFSNEYSYPSDYPSPGDSIVFTGELELCDPSETYTEVDYRFANATFEYLEEE